MKSTKNSGFTLMELLLVIIIMGIAASFAFLSISNIGASSARKAATDMNYLLSRCRSACLSRTGESFITLRPAPEGGYEAVYTESGAVADTVSLGGKRVGCTYNEAEAVTGEGIKIGFQRSTGAERTDKGYTEASTIAFTGGGAEYKVSIVPATGSHSIS